MSTFVLKLIAIITMLIDHIGAVFIPGNSQLYLLMRIIGRLAFPIFAFLIVEGFFHTSDIKKYLTRLGIFALISEIPFDLAFYSGWFSNSGGNIRSDLKGMFRDPALFETVAGRFLEHQNIFFTLFLGLLIIYLMSLVENKFKKEVLISNLLDALLTIAFCAIALFLRTDYSIAGVLLIVAFYLFRGSKALMVLSLLIVNGALFQGSIQIFAVLAGILIAFYNGKKGKSIKYFFYVFYPAHLIILFLISTFIYIS